MKAKLILLSCLVALTAQSETLKLNEKFIRAIHQVETSGRTGPIAGDNGRALGPFQIHRAYWLDAAAFDKSLKGTYADCADYKYASRVVAAYLSRYGAKYIKSNDFKSLARLHNGGRLGNTKQATLGYWKRVQSWLDK